MFGNVQVDTGGDDGEAEEEEDYEDGPRRPQLSPIRLRMGWRSNGELEVRTGELQRMLDVLRSVSDDTPLRAAAEEDRPARARARREGEDDQPGGRQPRGDP